MENRAPAGIDPSSGFIDLAWFVRARTRCSRHQHSLTIVELHLEAFSRRTPNAIDARSDQSAKRITPSGVLTRKPGSARCDRDGARSAQPISIKIQLDDVSREANSSELSAFDIRNRDGYRSDKLKSRRLGRVTSLR